MRYRKDLLRDFREARGDAGVSGASFGLKNSSSLHSPALSALLTRPKLRKRTTQSAAEVEPLEPRILLAADLAPFAVAMIDGQNDLTLSATDDLIQVHDTFTGDLVAEQLRAETSSVVVTGTEGDDRLVMDMAGTYILPGGVMFDGAGGMDEIVGPDFDSTWIIDGANEGSVNGHDFANVETATGGADNEDLFHLSAGGQMTGGLEGGAGGFDSIAVDAMGLATEFLASGPDSGAITIGTLTTAYAGFEPVNVTGTDSITITFDNAGNAGVSLAYDSVASTDSTDVFNLTGPVLEAHALNITDSTTDVTINMLGGADDIAISGVDGTRLSGKLTIDLGSGDDTITLGEDFGDITILGGANTDTVNVTSPNPAIQIGDQIQGIDGVAALTSVETVTGDSTNTTLSQIRDGANQALDQLISLFEEVEGVGQFVSELPIISGSTVNDIADLTLGSIASFTETLKDVQYEVNEVFDDAAAQANDQLDYVRTQLDTLAATIEHLGAGVIPEITGVTDAINALTVISPGTFEFEIVLEKNGSALPAIPLNPIAVADILEAGVGDMTKLATAINAQIGLTDFASDVQALVREGRIAFQALGTDIEAMTISAPGGATNLASTLLGYGVPQTIGDVQEILTSLGDNLIDFDGVDIQFLSGTSYSFTFDLIAERTSEFGFDFGTNLDEQGLEFNADAKLETTFALLAGLDLTIDIGGLANPTDQSFTASAELGAGFEIDAAVSADATFGFLGVEAVGTVVADAGLRTALNVAFDSSTSDFGTIASDLAATNLNVVGFDAAGTGFGKFQGVNEDGATVDIDFTAKVGPDGTPLIAGTLELDFAVSSMFSDPDPMVMFDGGIAVADFKNFSNLSPTQVISALIELIGWLEDLTDSPIISDIDIPLVEGGLGAVLDLAQVVSDVFLYDTGGDGEKDDDTRLITLLNAALAGAGLDPYLRAVANGANLEIAIIDDDVQSVEFGDAGGLLTLLDFGGPQTIMAGSALSVLGSSVLQNIFGGFSGDQKSRITINFKALTGRDPIEDREISIIESAMEGVAALGDDAARLLDAFNSPLFSSATELGDLLSGLGILPDVGDLNYDLDEDQLTYKIAINSEPLFDVELDSDFEIDLAPILEVESNSKLILSGKGTINLVLGFDLSPGDVPGESTILDGATTTMEDIGVIPGETLKLLPAVTAAGDPNSIQGLLTADATFTIALNDGTAETVEIDATETFGFTTAAELAGLIDTKVDAALGSNAVNVTAEESNGSTYLNFAASGSGTTKIEIGVTQGDPAIQGLGLQNGQVAEKPSTSNAELRALIGLPEFIGIVDNGDSDTEDSETFSLTIGGTTYTVSVAEEATKRIDDKGNADPSDDTIVVLNRNIIDLIADVEAALAEADPGGGANTVNLNDQIEVGFQGSRLVLTSTGDVPFSVSGGASLGFVGTQNSDTNDIIVRVEGASDVVLSFDTLTETSTLNDLLAIFNAPGNNLTVSITADDPSTAENEGAKSLTLVYTGPGNLTGVEATNGSALAATLGLVGLDENPFISSSEDDETIIGSPIGGIKLVDRFFLADDPDQAGNQLADVLGFEFDAIFGRIVNDIKAGPAQNQIISDSVDLRDFVGETIEFRDIDPGNPTGLATNGFNAGVYVIDSVAIEDTDPGPDEVLEIVATLNGNAWGTGLDELSGGFGIINAGFDAGASLGFIDISLEDDTSSGASTFGANLSIGFNTGQKSDGTAAAAQNGILSLGEIIDTFTAEDATLLDAIKDLLTPPDIEFDAIADNFGGVNLELDVSVGSADFADIATEILGNIDTSFSLDIIALGDPFLGTKFLQASVASVAADQIVVNGDFDQAIAVGADIKFEFDGVSEEITRKVSAVSTVAGVTTIDFEPLASDGVTDEPDLPAGGTLVDAILLPTVDAQLPDLGAIGAPDFSNFGIDEIIQVLQALVDILEDVEGLDFLQTPIPVIDRSVADLIDLADDINDFIEEFQANPSGSLQFIEDAINDAIGIGSSALQGIADEAGVLAGEYLSFDDPFDIGLMYEANGAGVGDDEWMLTFEFTLGAYFNEMLPVGFDLAGAFGGDFPDLVNLAGSANLEASGGVLLQLGLGFEISEFVSDGDILGALKILDSTQLRANLSIGATNLAFAGGLGPFTLTVRDDGASNPAQFTIDLSLAVVPTFTGVVSFSDVNFQTDFDVNDGSAIGNQNFGTINGNLPVYAPTDSSYAGAIKIGERVETGAGNLLNIDNIDLITDGSSPDVDSLAIDVSELVTFVSNFNPAELSLFDQIILAVDAFDGFLDLLQADIFGNIAELDIPLVGEAFADAAAFIRDFQEDFVGPLRTAIETLKNAVDDFTVADKNIISNLLFDLLGPSGLDLLVPLVDFDASLLPDDLFTPGVLTAEDYIALDAEELRKYIDGEDNYTLADALIAWDFKIGDPLLDDDGSLLPGATPLASPGIGFDLGIPGLGLETNGSLDIFLGWELMLGFGLSGEDGFFFNVEDDSELQFDVVVQVQEAAGDESEIRGTLGFLELTGDLASRDLDGDGIAETTEVRASFAVDIFEEGATGEDAERLSFTELGNIGFAFGAYAKASAVLDLRLGIASDLVGDSLSAGLPSVVAGFNFLWEFGNEGGLVFSNDPDVSFGDALEDSLKLVAFNDVGIDAGEFVSEVLKPIVDQVAEVTGPIQPIIDFITAPIPVINQLGLNLTLLDVAGFFGDVDAGLIKSIAEVITVINTIAALPDDIPSLIIPIVGNGNLDDIEFDDAFIIFADDDLITQINGMRAGDNQLAGGFANPFSSDTDLSDQSSRDSLFGQQGNVISGLGDLIGDLDGLTGLNLEEAATQNALSSLANNTDDEKVFRFPWLDDPTTIFNLILGEPLDLIIVDPQPLVLGFEWSQFFSIFGPLGVSITLEIEAALDFIFGFDTQGIQDFVDTGAQNPLLILNGLYVGDTVDGEDVPEVRLFGGITAAAELNLGVARAGVAGGLFIEILFDLFDPNDDGKVRIFELLENIENEFRGGSPALAPLAIFDVTGEIFARLFAFLKIDLGLFEIDKEFDILPPITLLEFSIDFFRPPVMATEQPNGDLIVNVGTFANQRLLGNTADFDENIRVEKIGTDGDDVVVRVYSENAATAAEYDDDAPAGSTEFFTYKVAKGARIVIDSGDQNDNIKLIGFEGSEVEFVIDGGGGNDTIIFEGAVVPGHAGEFGGFHTITGGAGADMIIGSLGTDIIIGGAGDDTITGSDGDDLIFGDGYQLLDTSAIGAAASNDGNDSIEGGGDDDIIFGSGGADIIKGNGGGDLILADGGKVNFADTGKKIRSNVLDIWNSAVENADLGEVINADDIDAGSGDDIVFAGGGNDTIEGGADDDLLFAGEGSDTVTETDGVNIIFGDLGAMVGDYTGFIADVKAATNLNQTRAALEDIVDVAQVGFGAGRDIITGGSDEDLIFAGEGNDSVDGGDGSDFMLLGGGADTGLGGMAGDFIYGEAGPDLIEGQDGDDLLNGGTGPDSIEGGAGNDQIEATQGNDTLIAGTGEDAIRVYFQGGLTSSDITIDGGSDADTLLVYGTIKADDILLRADITGDTGFIANILGEFNVERVNYNDSLERVIVNGGLGDDYFAVDDTAAPLTINGELGDDKFQIGQLYRTERLGPETNLVPFDDNPINGITDENAFRTIAVTRGYLSYGISEVMTVNGGLGNDEFIVFHNAAVLQLNGDGGDDEFTVRAFALVGSQEPLRERTDLSGGAGADLVRYAVNAPVNIDGGDGFDTLIVIGTEFGDDFVITEEGVFGAGLNVNFVNIENLRVDGAEGNDRFFVQSTKETFLTEIFGGLGEDTFFMSGETPPVVSNDLRGHSGIIAHDMESSLDGSAYNGQTVFGISANVADDEEPFAVITPTGGSTTITEGDATGDTYSIVLTRKPTKDVVIFISAPIPSPDGREKDARFFRMHSDAAGAEMLSDGSGLFLTFTDENWNVAQEIKVVADSGDGIVQDSTPLDDDPIDEDVDDADRYDSGRLFTRDDTDPREEQFFDYDDDAYEGTITGIAVHKFEARDTAAGDETKFASLTLGGTPVVTVTEFSGVFDGAAEGTVTTADAQSLIGHRFKITEGPGAVEERLILDASVSGGVLTLTLNKPYTGDDIPDVTESHYEIIVDDAVRGRLGYDTGGSVDPIGGIFEEVVGLEVFDDRTFINIGAKADDGLIGRVFEIISGPGAGQSAMVLSANGTYLDADGVALPGTGWIELNAKFESDLTNDSAYRMKLYDGLAAQVTSVTVNDNDLPNLVTDQTSDYDGGGVDGIDDITAVIEGSDGDQRGEQDVIKFRLNQMPSATVTVLVSYDPEQLDLTLASATKDANAGTLTFDIAPGDWDMVNNIIVAAADDVVREGFHNSLIEFSFSAGGDTDGTLNKLQTITIDPDVQTASVGLDFVPTTINSVLVGGIDIDDIPTLGYGVIDNKVIFYNPSATPGAFDPGNSELVPLEDEVTISYDYTDPGFDGRFSAPVLVRLADDDSPTLIVRETGGSTDVIETDVYLTNGKPVPDQATDSYELVLTAAPDAAENEEVKIYVDELITKTTKTGGLRSDEIQVIATSTDARFGTDLDGRSFVTFDSTNWDQAISIDVVAVPDDFVDGDDTKVFAPGPATLAGILGPVIVDGEGGNGSLSGLEDPLMLPGETNDKPPTGDALTIDNTAATVTIARADITNQVMHDLRLPDRIDPSDTPAPGGIATNADLDNIIDKTLEIVRAPAAPSVVDQFRQIIGYTVLDQGTGDLSDDKIVFQLNAPYELGTNAVGESENLEDPSQADELGFQDEPEDQVNRYAITSESLNFFVKEEELVDRMIVNDTDSPADSAGVLTASRLYGFNMGPDILIGDQVRQGGITYGNLEVLDLNLGRGFNDLDILGTMSRDDGFKTWTFVNGGDDVPYDLLPQNGDMIDAYVTVDDVFHVETATGDISGTNPDAFDPFTRVELAGYDFADGLLEGSVLIFENTEQGETTTFERIVRSNSYDDVTDTTTLILDAPLPELTGGGVDLDGETIWQIVNRADGGLVINGQGGDDVIDAGLDAVFAGVSSDLGIVVFGGAGNDTITGGLGEDILFGDEGRVDYRNNEGAIITRAGLSPEPIFGKLTTFDGDGTTTLNVLAFDPDVPNEGATVDLPVADGNDGSNPLIPASTADTGLVGLYIDINDGTGFRQPPKLIIGNSATTIEIDDDNPFTQIDDFDDSTRFRISTIPEDQTDGFDWGASYILAIASDDAGDDVINGGDANDILIGGQGNDTLNGDAGDDAILGDLGTIELARADGTPAPVIDPTLGWNAQPTRLDVVRSIALDLLGSNFADNISGGEGQELIFGGQAGDTIDGNDDADIILGDAGYASYENGTLVSVVTVDQDPSETGTDTGGSDTIDGGSADDIILGGTAGDRLSGGTDDDLILGDYGTVIFDDARAPILAKNFVSGDEAQRFLGGNDTIFGNQDDDLLIGAAGNDLIDGDEDRDMIFGDNVTLTRDTDALSFTDPRFRTLATSLYGTGVSETFGNGSADHSVLVDGTALTEPGVPMGPWWRSWSIDIQDHTLADEAESRADAGDDYIAGGTEEDMIFGQLGDDVIQGDGSIDSADSLDSDRVGASRDPITGALTVNASFETTGDADDYIEGNGGDDVIFGNLGQDDIIGDNSDLFSLGDLAEREPVGSDMIFGGSGLRDGRHEYVETSNDAGDAIDIVMEDRHARDADMILGDNGRIFRLVTDATGENEFLEFRYDTVDDNPNEHYLFGDDALNRSDASERIVVRAADLIDYAIGGIDVGAPAGLGAADEIHGETGDDFIYGMVGDDSLFGDSEDDDIIAGQGHDWVSGGTGLDGVLGGDGRIFTAKNSTTVGEDLNNIDALAEVNQFISTPGDIQQSTINIDNALKKIVDISPFFPDETTVGAIIEDGSNNDNDIIFGGLGSDSLHGGFGSDAISGAEAMPGDVVFSLDGVDHTFTDLLYSFDNPGNPGDILAFGQAANRSSEFAAYDEFNPRPIIFVDPGTFEFVSDLTGLEAGVDYIPFVLNHLADDKGAGAEEAPDGVISDGDDRIFGDTGHDWLVGGTGRDNIYGGFGSDYLDADDDRSTDLGRNQSPDSEDSYADIAYGGAGRDWIVGNTGGDRLIDWVGEFNAYIVPFAPFGAFTVSRTVQPQIFDYLYDLSAADGADPTRDVDGDTARNGEPYGEIGAVKQQDPFWKDQTGAPDDPQAGNIPGGKRDVMAAENFNSASDADAGLLGFAADSGSWSTENGRLVIAPQSVGSDAVSVFHVQNALPSYFEMVADVQAAKDRFGYDSNAFMIFDYYAPDDFKFAGINADINKIQIGHRDANGWHVDEQTNMRLRPDTNYNLLVAVNGTTVTALVDGSTFATHTFDPRIDDGIPQGINRGMIGFGADNSFTRADNFAIQVLPPNLTYEKAEDFDDGVANDFTGASVGNWSVSGGQFNALPGPDGYAFQVLDLSGDTVSGELTIGANSKVKLSADVNTADMAGIIFDHVSDSRFKFAILDVENDELVIGHYEAGKGWVEDTSVAMALDAGTDYTISVLLSGATASVDVDGVFMLSHAFNAVTVDGNAGLIARDGPASFDNTLYATDEPSLAVEVEEALRASSVGSGGETLSQDDLEDTVEVAIKRLILSEDLNETEVAYLRSLDLQIANLEGDLIAVTDGTSLTFDIDAAGHGYFVDNTPMDDAEFDDTGEAHDSSLADGKIDLMTAAMHELGHALGFDHVSSDSERAFMIGVLDPSQRLGLFDTDSSPVQVTQESGTSDLAVYDERLDEFVTPDEALLLDGATSADAPEQGPVSNALKRKNIKWLAG